MLKKEGGKVYAAFIDFKKAFDTVDRVIFEEKLRAIGVEGRFLNWVKVIYKEMWFEVITSKGVSKTIKNTRGSETRLLIKPKPNAF